MNEEMKKPSTLLLYTPKLLSDLNANTYTHRITSAQSLLYDVASQDKHQAGLFMGFGMLAVRNNSINTQGFLQLYY